MFGDLLHWVAQVENWTCGEDLAYSFTESFPLSITCGCDGTTEEDDGEVEDEEHDEQEDADAADTDASSATPSAAVGGATAMFLAAAVSWQVLAHDGPRFK